MLLATRHLRPFAPFGVGAWWLGTLLAEASAPAPSPSPRTGAVVETTVRQAWHMATGDAATARYGAQPPASPLPSPSHSGWPSAPDSAARTRSQPGPLYCNVTHAGSITTYDLALANVDRLAPLGDLPCDRNPGCARVACVDDSAVIVCNDGPARVRPAYSLVAEYALRIMGPQEDGGCTFWGPEGDLLVNGQLFNATAGWNVIVAGQNCCGTMATSTAAKRCGPFPSAGIPN